MAIYLIQILSLLVLVACGQNGDSANASENNYKPAPEILACAFEGSVTIEGTGGQPICLDPVDQNICLRDDYKFVRALDKEGGKIYESCLSFHPKENSYNSLRASKIRISLETSREDRMAFARWADQNKPRLRKLQGFHSTGNFGQIITVAERPSTFLLEGVLNPELMVGEADNDRKTPHAPLFFQNTKDLISFIEGNRFKEDFKTNRPLIQELIELNQKKYSPQLSETYSEKGCAATCIKTTGRIKVDRGTAFYREYQSNNQPYRWEWVYENEKKQVVALLYMAKQNPILGITIDRNLDQFANNVEVRDRNNQIVLSKTWKQSKLVGAPSKAPLVPADQVDLPLVGLCEENLNPNTAISDYPGMHILAGPYQDQSYFGWLQSENSFDVSGRLFINKLGLPYENFELRQHASQVAGELAHQTDIGILPLGVESCLNPERANKWYPSVVEAGTRVINVSLRLPMDAKTCAEWAEHHPIGSSFGELLWVVAAGNQGVGEANGCPQHLSGSANIIIVGASQGKRVHHSSNYGEDLVDIYAAGTTHNGSAWGTSMAAPKVAKIAAMIFQEHPEFTVLQAKASLLLSADVPYRKLPGRSDGILDAEAALIFAEDLAKNGGDVPQVLEQAHCRLFCGKTYKNKMKIWEKIKQGGSQ